MFDINEELEILAIDTGIPLSRINELYNNTSSYKNSRESVACYAIQVLRTKAYLLSEFGVNPDEQKRLVT